MAPRRQRRRGASGWYGLGLVARLAWWVGCVATVFGCRSEPPAVHDAPITDATLLVAHGSGTCAVRSGGELVCWGAPRFGVLSQARGGDAERADLGARQVAAAVAGLAPVEEVALGGARCVRLTGGEVRCAGFALDGKGGGPELVAVPELQGAEQLALGLSGACARFAGGTVRCWGTKLERAAGPDGTLPPPLDDAVEIAVDGLGLTLLVRRRDGTVVCAGFSCWAGAERDHGAEPVGGGLAVWEIPALAGATALADGAGLAALLAGGVPVGLGTNAGHQLRADGEPFIAEPVPVHDLAGVTQLVLGVQHSCAVFDDGALRCWGENDAGQLGDGTTTDPARPVEVVGLAEVAEVAVGGRHTCARQRNGRVSCWGSNDGGALGDGTRGARSHPAPVLMRTRPRSR